MADIKTKTSAGLESDAALYGEFGLTLKTQAQVETTMEHYTANGRYQKNPSARQSGIESKSDTQVDCNRNRLELDTQHCLQTGITRAQMKMRSASHMIKNTSGTAMTAMLAAGAVVDVIVGVAIVSHSGGASGNPPNFKLAIFHALVALHSG